MTVVIRSSDDLGNEAPSPAPQKKLTPDYDKAIYTQSAQSHQVAGVLLKDGVVIAELVAEPNRNDELSKSPPYEMAYVGASYLTRVPLQQPMRLGQYIEENKDQLYPDLIEAMRAELVSARHGKEANQVFPAASAIAAGPNATKQR